MKRVTLNPLAIVLAIANRHRPARPGRHRQLRPRAIAGTICPPTIERSPLAIASTPHPTPATFMPGSGTYIAAAELDVAARQRARRQPTQWRAPFPTLVPAPYRCPWCSCPRRPPARPLAACS